MSEEFTSREATLEEMRIVWDLSSQLSFYISQKCKVNGKQYAHSVMLYIIANQMQSYDDCLDYTNLICKLFREIERARQENEVVSSKMPWEQG